MMRTTVLFLTLTLAATFPAAAQTSVRSGSARPAGVIQGGPGRVASPTPGTARGVSTIQPGKPDARLGAGGVHPASGNIVYPGTPYDRSPGNILSPGIPTVAQPVPSVVQPPSAQSPRSPDQGRDRPRSRRFNGAYPIYGVYAYPLVPNVISVEGSTVTRSGAGYVVTVGDDPAAALAEEPQEDGAEPAYWLIALRGGLIYAVSDYEVEDRAVRFVTLQGDEYVIPVAELDRAFTAKLNRDRGVVIELD